MPSTKDKSRSREFDIIAFIEALKEVYDYFPEYKGKRIIPIFSSLSILLE
ncbi:MAG: hypothetical protein JETT_0137 [Candidatus Jettenia ecosi]|uniref:Uncharacterized protein n=1 Tax=Candidatus Jettenia ecosi TaxID=2494326 RepID=A0A533QFF3_9BACT|nr:MAG: hypothetical protein JETT_0137 [Candidatus Jettenia ecosi]